MLNWSEDLFDQFPKMCRQRFDDGSIFVPIALVQTVRRSFDRGLDEYRRPVIDGMRKRCGGSIHGISMGREQKNGLALPRG
jgi:hypothetical protein